MPESRRQFLGGASAGLIAAAAAVSEVRTESAWSRPAGARCRPSGSCPKPVCRVSTRDVRRSRGNSCRWRLAPADRQMAADSWRRTLASLYERRTGPKKLAIEAAVAPATRWDPVLPGLKNGPERDRFVRTKLDPGPLPANDADIAFAPLTHLSRWIETRKLTSERLTNIYLDRLQRFDPKLRCVITLTHDLALEQAKSADAEIAVGKYRGPLHGVPFGVKDLLDTAGIATTWGAEPYRNRVPTTDSAVVKRLHDAGAVLVAKLSLGALALNDIWFGGQTMNPWLLEEGASGSSAGPGAATGAGLVGLFHRQRDQRQYRRPQHALRGHRAAPHVRPRAAHRAR